MIIILKQFIIDSLTIAILSLRNLNRIGIKRWVFSFSVALFPIFSKIVSLGLQDLFFKICSSTVKCISLIGGREGNIFILKLVSEMVNSFSKFARSCSLHKLSPRVFFSWRLDGGSKILAFVSSLMLMLSIISMIEFLISWGSFS